MDFAEVGVGDVGVDLGGGDVGVAEDGLDGAEVGAVHEEVGGEGVAEGVGGDVFGDAGLFGVFLDDAFDGAGGEAAVVAGGGGEAGVFAVVEEEGGEGVFADFEVLGDFEGGGFADEDGAVFFAFAADGEFAAVEIDGVAIEGDEFGDAEAGGEEEFDDGAVAEAGFGVGGDGVEEGFDFVVVEEGDLFFDGFGEVDEARVEGFDVAFAEVFEEAAEGDEVVGLGEGGEGGGGGAVEPEAVFAEEFGGDFGGF